MKFLLAGIMALPGGFAIMVLEIVGARYLAKDFGSSFYVWTSQIGVVLIALALGYFLGGALADRFKSASFLAWLLVPAGAFTFFTPNLSPTLIDAIIQRHPLDEPIPLFWQKLDPALGSGLVFLFPCLVLAILPPYLIRLSTHSIAHVGRMSGMIYGASTVGSIAGVFVSGYILIDLMRVTHIFQATGVVVAAMGVASLFVDRLLKPVGTFQ